MVGGSHLCGNPVLEFMMKTKAPAPTAVKAARRTPANRRSNLVLAGTVGGRGGGAADLGGEFGDGHAGRVGIAGKQDARGG